MRNSVRLLSPIRSLLKLTPTYLCSTNRQGLPQPQFQDWEYCKLISKEIKNRDPNAGLNLLLQSYFDNQVLDIQIYNSLFQSLHQHHLALSYSEILYQVYRNHFPPLPLLLTWMQKLTHTHDESLLSQLHQDYEAIHQPFPTRKPRRNNQKQHPVIKETMEETPKTRKARLQRQNQEGSKETKQGSEESEVQYIEPNLSPEEAVKLQMQNDFKGILGQFSSYGKINLYDVEIDFNEPSGQGEEEDYQMEHDDEFMQPQDLGLMGMDINRIKIGRVEFIADPDKVE